MTAPAPTPTEQATLDRIEAVEDAEESFHWRLSVALCVELESLGLSGEVSSRASDYLADAAIAVMRPARAAALTATPNHGRSAT